MSGRILLVSDKRTDLELIQEVLGPRGFETLAISPRGLDVDLIARDGFDVILADYDVLAGRTSQWIERLQRSRSRACLILYGDKARAETISDMLQRGIYAFVPRALLSERIHEAVLGGLENRRAFLEILGMIGELQDVNQRLQREKQALRKKIRELGLISHLSSEVAYDLNWERILPRILDAGLLKVLDHQWMGILYRLGPGWHLALHVTGAEIHKGALERLKQDLAHKFVFLSKEKLHPKEIALHLYPPHVRVSNAPGAPGRAWVHPLVLAGRPLGMLALIPGKGGALKEEEKALLSTIANILAISLKNAQEHQMLREMTVTDALTGILNRKGFTDFIHREFHRARRHHKPLTLIMLDVDNFKGINDAYGHLAGDCVLRELATCLKRSLRNSDVVARYGGDEFAILLPETDGGRAKMLLKRVLHNIKGHLFQWGPHRIWVEVSPGIASLNDLKAPHSEKELICLADARLYEVKRLRGPLYSMG